MPTKRVPEGGRTGHLYVISGPSGAGKGTLVEMLRGNVEGLWVSISATTRPPRKGEVEGVHYFFKTDAEFDDLIANDGLLEWANVHGHRYGTPRGPVLAHIASGDQVILEIEPQGAFQVRDKYPDCILIFIEPPSMEELKRRLVGRGTETSEQIAGRLEVAQVEMAREVEYDVVVRNDDLDSAARELIGVIDDFATGSRTIKRT